LRRCLAGRILQPGGRTAVIRFVTFVCVVFVAAGLVAAERPRDVSDAGQAAAPDAAVGAFLDGLYAAIAAAHPTPEQPSGKGLYKPPPMANNDRTRREFRIASGVSDLLHYDFVKLAVIQEYRYRFRMFEQIARVESIGGPLVLYGLARALPKELPGRQEALAALRSDHEWTYPPK
jgi:hypothetical protein